MAQEGRARQVHQSRIGVRVGESAAFAPSYDLPVAKISRKGTLPLGVSEDTERFSPLKTVLGSIPAAFANREVRFHLPSPYSPLMIVSPGKCRRGKQD